MPTVLAEVGSITLRAEHDLLSSAAGHAAVADGLYAGLVDFFAARDVAARIGLVDQIAGEAPNAVPGDGPPFWAPEAPDGPMRVRVTNNGVREMEGAQLVAGWEASDQPYLAAPPAALRPIGEPLPTLEPGESVVIEVSLPDAIGGARALAWISLLVEGTMLSELGSPALQLASGTP